MRSWQVLDHQITKQFFEAGQRSKAFWIFCSQIGFPFLMLGTFVFCWRLHDFRILPFTIDITVFAFVLTVVLQEILRRHRPTDELHGAYHALALKWSFPSAHASTAFAWATTFAIGFWRVAFVAHAYEVALLVSVWIVAGCIAISRVFLGVHHFFDVAAGALLGIALSIIIIAV